MTALLSPTSGLPLRPHGPASLSDGRERWPCLDGIAYLRTGRDDLVRAALASIDRGDTAHALALLLADQDEWWDGPAPDPASLARLVSERGRLTLRDAMGLLAYGRVGDYFAHRWSDPTYLAGLALLDAHWTAPASAFELACGIGHYLRDLQAEGVAVTGGDIVFSKLWLARHWVAGADAELCCFDARSPWPIAGRRFDLCLCQDAFYFLEPKAEILARLRGLTAGPLVVGHIHNREAANMSAGAGVSAGDLASLFPDAAVYDDAELTEAARDGRPPRARPLADLRSVDAFALAERAAAAPCSAAGPLCRPKPGAPLRRNPLYRSVGGGGAEIVWPSERYGAEYGPRATYPRRTDLAEQPAAWSDAQARRREVVSLPERW